MSNNAAPLHIWHARRPRTPGDYVYIVYVVALIVVMVVPPTAKAIGGWAGHPVVEDALRSARAPDTVSMGFALVLAGVLLLGRVRGPALSAPFPTFVLFGSPRPRWRTLARPLLLAAAIPVGLASLLATFAALSLLSSNGATLWTVGLVALLGIPVGLLVFVAWVVGQCFPPMAVLLSVSMTVIALAQYRWPLAPQFVPWNWVGQALLSSNRTLFAVLIALAATACTVMVPRWLERIRPADALLQAKRWTMALTMSASLDFQEVARIYQPEPQWGRRIRVVNPRVAAVWQWFRANAVGSARTPQWFIPGLGGLLVLSAAIPWLMGRGPAGAWWGGAMGVLVFACLGSATEGIRHAVRSFTCLPLYGTSDAVLVLRNCVWPLSLALPCTLITVVAATFMHGPVLASVGVVLSMLILGLLLRVMNALKGPLPFLLNTSAATPLGDPMPFLRLLWACDAVAFAAVGGLVVTMFPYPAVAMGVLVLVVAAVVLRRWKKRGQ